MMRKIAILLLAVSSVAFTQNAPPPQRPTEISADLGPCTVDFHVTDLDGKGVYNANVHVLIRYGFLSKRKLELDAGTNADGRVRFTHLPVTSKKPLIFTIKYQSEAAVQTYDPDTNCHASYDIPLKVKQGTAQKP